EELHLNWNVVAIVKHFAPCDTLSGSDGCGLIYSSLLIAEARIDLGKRAIDKEVVEKVWNRIAPGLASNFDAPYTVPAISPRPLLILNGAEDPRCPCGGLEILSSRAYKAYDEANVPDKFKVITETGIGHQMTKSMVKAASDWFDKYLKQ
ncbi:hypothetical protein LINPERPRIM_LOCUS1425, partial [Linum perenne]